MTPRPPSPSSFSWPRAAGSAPSPAGWCATPPWPTTWSRRPGWPPCGARPGGRGTCARSGPGWPASCAARPPIGCGARGVAGTANSRRPRPKEPIPACAWRLPRAWWWRRSWPCPSPTAPRSCCASMRACPPRPSPHAAGETPAAVRKRLSRAYGLLRTALDRRHGGDRRVWCAALAHWLRVGRDKPLPVGPVPSLAWPTYACAVLVLGAGAGLLAMQVMAPRPVPTTSGQGVWLGDTPPASVDPTGTPGTGARVSSQDPEPATSADPPGRCDGPWTGARHRGPAGSRRRGPGARAGVAAGRDPRTHR